MHHVLADGLTELRGGFAELTAPTDPFPYEEGYTLFRNLATLIAAGHVSDPRAACQSLLSEVGEDEHTLLANGKAVGNPRVTLEEWLARDCAGLSEGEKPYLGLVTLGYIGGMAVVPLNREDGTPYIEGSECIDYPENIVEAVTDTEVSLEILARLSGVSSSDIPEAVENAMWAATKVLHSFQPTAEQPMKALPPSSGEVLPAVVDSFTPCNEATCEAPACVEARLPEGNRLVCHSERLIDSMATHQEQVDALCAVMGILSLPAGLARLLAESQPVKPNIPAPYENNADMFRDFLAHMDTMPDFLQHLFTKHGFTYKGWSVSKGAFAVEVTGIPGRFLLFP